MKKLLLFVTVLFAVCLLAVSVSAVEVDGIYYSFTKTDAYPGFDGTATVNTENRTSGTLTNVVIPEIVNYDKDGDGTTDEKYVVTAVADSAFGANGGSNSPVVSVFIPKTVKSIGNHVFRQLKCLETVEIEARGYNPSTGEDYTAEISFSNAEFYNTKTLLSVDMSKSNVVQLGQYCFEYDSNLHTVLFSKNIKRIYAAFNGCSSLATINSIESIEEIGRGFYNTKISGDIKLPNIKSLGENAFRDTLITSVDMSGAPLKNVGPRAFQNCKNLTSVILPENVEMISEYAFNSVSKNVVFNGLPRTITYIGSSAFWGPNIIGDLVFDTITYIGNNSLRDTDITSLVILNGTIKGENGAADKVLTNIGTDGAFYSCNNLEYIVFPDTMVSSGNNTFVDCGSLKYIISSSNWTSVTSKPSKADLIIKGTEADANAMASAWSGWSVAPFSDFNPENAGTKTIYYGATATSVPATFISFNGFDKEFSVWNAATNQKTSYSAIFTASGYSAGPDNNGIATGYQVSHDSLATYETLTGKSVGFGVVIFNPKYLGSDGIFNADGTLNATKGALQVALDITYKNCNVSVNGMTGHESLELVFAGYAYTDDDMSTAQLLQKEYVGAEDSAISSPMASKVTRGDTVLYTVKLQSILTPAQITSGKEGLGEYTVA